MKVKTKNELRKIILENLIPLETLDVSNITDMDQAFSNINRINGSISNWDVSNVTNMSNMFTNSSINPDISSWNVSNVTSMNFMFYGSKFNGDISSWNISKVEEMKSMFEKSIFSHNIYSWNIEGKSIANIFKDCPYSYKQYEKNRKEYLDKIELEKQILIQEENKKYLLDEKNRLDNELSKNIEVSTIEMEF